MGNYGMARYGNDLFGAVAHPYVQVSGRVLWLVQVDWQRSGGFDSLVESQKISKLSIRRGRGARLRADGLGQVQPEDESFEIEMVDPERCYDALNPESPLYPSLGAPGLLLRVLAVSSSSRGAAEPVFCGTLTRVSYDYHSGRALLSGTGLAQYLQLGEAASVVPPCQSGSTMAYDDYFHWDGSTPVPLNYWKGRPGGLTLRECVGIVLRLAGWPLGSEFGSLQSDDQPDYFFADGGSAWEILKDLADGFCARLFFRRGGALLVIDRADMLGASETRLDPPGRALEKAGLTRGSPFETLRNRIEVKVRPHAAPRFSSPLTHDMYRSAWVNAGPLAVDPGSQVEIEVKYPVSPGRPLQGSLVEVNADDPTDPSPLAVWSNPDRTGVNMGLATGNGEGEFTLLTEQSGENGYGATYVPAGNQQNFCRVRLTNHSGTRTAYFFNLQVRLLGVWETGEALSLSCEDADSVAANGLRIARINNRWIQTPGMASRIGQAYLQALAQRERASSAGMAYAWGGDELYANLLKYDLGEVVNFERSGWAFGLGGKWLISGQELSWLSPDGQQAIVKLRFEKMPALQVTRGSVSTVSGNHVSSASWRHTVANGFGRLLLVAVMTRGTGSVSGVSRGGVSLARLADSGMAGAAYARVSLFALVAPALGTATLQVTLEQADYFEAGALDLVNVDQESPFGAVQVELGNNGMQPSLSLPLAEGDLGLDVLSYWDDSQDAAPVSGQQELWNVSADGGWKGAASTLQAVGTTSMGWSVPGAAWWAHLAVRVRSA